MTNKFLDIIPPGTPKALFSKKVPQTAKPNSFKKGIIIFFTVFLGLFLLCHFVFSQAEVKIWPKTELLEFSETITVSVKTGDFDFSEKTIPGRFFEKIQKDQQSFSASEIFSKEEKARGTVKVFNKHNPAKSLSLIAGTRFLSSDSEKYFTASEKIYIPAAKYEGGKLVAQWTEAKIVAMEPGEDYNIGPTTFSIPGLVGTSYYYSTWGESSENMSGGINMKKKRISQNDLDNAQKVLTEKLLEEVESSLRNNISSEFILLKDALTKEITDKSSLAAAGAEVESFIYEAEAMASALIFKKTDIERFAQEHILSQIPSIENNEIFLKEKKLLPESLTISYQVESIDLENGQIILNLEFSGKVYSDVDEVVLKRSFSRKSLLEINTFLENQPQIIGSETKFWPFWIGKAPDEPKKIKIELELGVD